MLHCIKIGALDVSIMCQSSGAKDSGEANIGLGLAMNSLPDRLGIRYTYD